MSFIYTDQPTVFNELCHGQGNLLITGDAGTGKSYIIQKWLQQTSNVAVCAPTGFAALNIGGQTLHRYFQIPFKLYNPEKYADLRAGNIKGEKLNTLINLETLLIDEISMVRSDVMEYIDSLLRTVRKSSLTWGGVRVVGVGDPFQLSPVVPKHEKDKNTEPWFFQSEAWRSLPFKAFYLKNIYRQTDSVFAGLLKRIRVGQATHEDIALINTRVAPASEGAVHLAATNNVVDKKNEEELAKLPGQSLYYGMSTKSNDPKYKIEKYIPVPAELSIKKDARIMLVTNHYGENSLGRGDWGNGSTGTVIKVKYDIALQKDYIVIQLDTGNIVDVYPNRWETTESFYDKENQQWEKRVIATAYQFPIKLGWAVTIHRIQGQTLNKIHFYPDGIFAPGQVYVALSRIRDLRSLTLESPIKKENISVNPEVINFFYDLKSPLT